MKKIKSNIVNIFFLAFATLALVSCDEDGYDDYGTDGRPAQSMSGEWFIDISDGATGEVLAEHTYHETYDDNRGNSTMIIDDHQTGWSIFLDSRYQLAKPALVFSTRVQFFNTGGYESRIYAYERDLLYSFSIPAFYDKGVRYYCQLQGKPARFGHNFPLKLQWWLRWSQTLYGKGHTIGSGTDEIKGNKKSEWKMQVMLTL